jgi:hypothetical protein
MIPLATLAMAVMHPILAAGMMIVFKIVSDIVSGLLAGILNLSILPAEFLDKNYFLVTTSNGVQTLAIAMLGLFTAYYGVKSMFLYLGFESEEPWKIMARVGISAVLIYASFDICKMCFELYGVLQDTIFNAFGIGAGGFDEDVFSDVISDGMFNTLEPFSQMFDLVVFLTMAVKILMLAVKFIERQVLLMVLVIFAPILFACTVAQPVRQYFTAWVKSFAGNLVIQGVQVVGVCLIFVILQSGVYKTATIPGLNNIIQNLMILGCISVIVRAETITVSVIGMSYATDLGASGFNMAKGVAANIIPQTRAAGALAKSIGS